MTTNETNTNTNTSVPSVADRRKVIRDAIMSAKPKSIKIECFGQEVEVRQPTLKVIMNAQSSDDRALSAANMIIRHTFVPGTNERVFEDVDAQYLTNLPFNESLQALNNAINKLVGIDAAVEDQTKNS